MITKNLESVPTVVYNFTMLFCKGGTVVKYITIKEASTKWEISIRRVNLLCNQGRVYGAYRLGNVWAIPENAKKPEDPRKTNNKE